jgi:hypothetical protein
MAELDALVHVPTVVGVPVDSDYEPTENDVESDAADYLRRAVEQLRTNAHFLAFIGDPLLTRTVTKRERTMIDKQLGAMLPLIDEIDELLDEVE